MNSEYRPIDLDSLYESLLLSFVAIVVTMFAIVVILFCPSIVFAQEATTVVDQVPNVQMFWSAIIDQNWPLVVGVGLTVIVWLFRNVFIKKLPKKALPWATLAVAVVGTTGTRIVQAVSESRTWWHGLVQGLCEGAVVGFTAMGAWDVKQTVVKKE